MSELLRQIVAGREHMQPRWSVARSLRVQDQMKQRQRRRARRKLVGAVTLGLALIWGGFSLQLNQPVSPPVEVAMGHTLELFDGSRVQFDPATTQVTVAQDGLNDSRLTLERGRADFDVVHRPTRTFAVQIGGVTIEVLGTQFSIERNERTVWVSVKHGKVAVRSSDGAALLLDGQELVVPLQGRARGVTPARPTVHATDAAGEVTFVPAAPRAQTVAPAKIREDDVALAFEKADALQDAGQAQEAVTLLRKVFIESRRDSRAPLAAFTAGRLLAEQLHQPREAASAFRVARLLAPLGPLAEDSWLRELECYVAVRAVEPAHSVGFEYLHRFPLGAHTTRVRQLLGDLPGEP